MPKWRIEHKKGECIGCGACTAIAPSEWKMEGDKSHLKGSEKEGELEVKVVDDLNDNQDAADSCPVPCIFVKKLDD